MIFRSYILFSTLKMSMSVPMEHSLVMTMPTALTLLEVSCAIASLDTLEMASLVKVCRGISIAYF